MTRIGWRIEGMALIFLGINIWFKTLKKKYFWKCMKKEKKMWLNLISISLYGFGMCYVFYSILCSKCWHCCQLRPSKGRTQTRDCCLATATTFHICWLPSTLLFSVCCDVCLLSMRSTREWKESVFWCYHFIHRI